MSHTEHQLEVFANHLRGAWAERDILKKQGHPQKAKAAEGRLIAYCQAGYSLGIGMIPHEIFRAVEAVMEDIKVSIFDSADNRAQTQREQTAAIKARLRPLDNYEGAVEAAIDRLSS